MRGVACCGLHLEAVVQISKLSSDSTAAAARPTMTSIAKRQSGSASVFDPSDPHPWAASMVAAFEEERRHLGKQPMAQPPDHIRHAPQESEPHYQSDSPVRFSRESGTKPLCEVLHTHNEAAVGLPAPDNGTAPTAAVWDAAMIDGDCSGSARAAWPETDNDGSRDSFAFGRQSDSKGAAAPTADSGDDHSCSSFSFSRIPPQPAARDSRDDSRHSFAGFPALALQLDGTSQGGEAHGPLLLPERPTDGVPLETTRNETPTKANYAALAELKQTEGNPSLDSVDATGQLHAMLLTS